MALPTHLTSRQLHAKFLDSKGDPMSGSVTFQAPFSYNIPEDDVIIGATPVVGILDENGEFTVTLPASNDPDATAEFVYAVTEKLDGIPDNRARSYNIAVPDDGSTDTLELSDLAPQSPITTNTAYLTKAQADALYGSGGGGGGSVDEEQVRDIIGAALTAGTRITISVDDVDDTITISTTATANSTDAQLRDRSTHTGVQEISTITDLATTLSSLASGIASKLDKASGVGARVWNSSTSTWPARPDCFVCLTIGPSSAGEPDDIQANDPRFITVEP